MIPAARPVFSDDDRKAITTLIDEALAAGSLTLGAYGAQLEAQFAQRHGTARAVATSSGTAALEILFRSLGVAGRDVVVPANTFFATAAAVLHAGGIPRLADVDPSTLCVSTETVEAAVGDNCAGVVVVHIGGLVTPDIDEIAAVCRRRGMFLVEDAAHAHGAAYDGRPAGSFGTAAAFSFYPTKVITSGEGGMIVTDDEGLWDEARVYRDQGKNGFLGGDHIRLGYAWRMSELHAAVGLVQLDRLDEFIATRRRIAAFYDRGLADVPGITPLLAPPGCESNYYKYVALLDDGIDREALKRRLRDEYGVSMSGEVYTKPLHRHPVFAELPHGPLPVAEDTCARQLCPPIHSDMTDAEADRVVTALAQALAGAVGR